MSDRKLRVFTAKDFTTQTQRYGIPLYPSWVISHEDAAVIVNKRLKDWAAGLTTIYGRNNEPRTLWSANYSNGDFMSAKIFAIEPTKRGVNKQYILNALRNWRSESVRSFDWLADEIERVGFADE